jgi:hypothetical protein
MMRRQSFAPRLSNGRGAIEFRGVVAPAFGGHLDQEDWRGKGTDRRGHAT